MDNLQGLTNYCKMKQINLRNCRWTTRENVLKEIKHMNCYNKKKMVIFMFCVATNQGNRIQEKLVYVIKTKFLFKIEISTFWGTK